MAFFLSFFFLPLASPPLSSRKDGVLTGVENECSRQRSTRIRLKFQRLRLHISQQKFLLDLRCDFGFVSFVWYLGGLAPLYSL